MEKTTFDVIRVYSEDGCWAVLAMVAAVRYILKDCLNTLDEYSEWREKSRTRGSVRDQEDEK